MEEHPKRRIAVVTLGGTFFMEGGKPGEIKLPELKAANPADRPSGFAENWNPIPLEKIEIEHHPLYNIDSSETRAKELNLLGRKLVELSNDAAINGVVVLSGTDKMHAIVTRMSHHLHNLKKPVIFTGAQVELRKSGTDAKRNYAAAVRAAYDLAEARLNSVLLCFGLGSQSLGAELYHPLNALKAHSTRLDAFNHEYKRVVGNVTWFGGVKTTALGKQMMGLTKTRVKRVLSLPRVERGTSIQIAGQLAKKKITLPTEFTPVREDLLDEVRLSETKSIARLRVDLDAKVIKLEGSGQGNIHREALEKIAQLAYGRPVIVTTEAGAHVNLTSYEPGRTAMQQGMLPSGGLISVTAGIRAEYLAHEMEKIENYTRKNRPPGMRQDEFQRRLFAALYLSGAEFKGKGTREKHEQALGIKIPRHNLLANLTIEDALPIAHKIMMQGAKEGVAKPRKPRKFERAPQNIMRPDRFSYRKAA